MGKEIDLMELRTRVLSLGDELLKELGIKHILIKVGYGTRFDSCGTYYGDTQEIVIRVNTLLHEGKKFKKETIEELLFFAKIILLHELGHAMDKTMIKNNNRLHKAQISFYNALYEGKDGLTHLKKCKKIIIEKEKIAWRFVYPLLSNNDERKLYKKFKKYALSTYFSFLESLKQTIHLKEVFKLIRTFSFSFSVPRNFNFYFFDESFSGNLKHDLNRNALEFNLSNIAHYFEDVKSIEKKKVEFVFLFLEEMATFHVEHLFGFTNTLKELKEKGEMFEEKGEKKEALEALFSTKKITLSRFDKISNLVIDILKENEETLVSSYKKYRKEKRDSAFRSAFIIYDYEKKMIEESL